MKISEYDNDKIRLALAKKAGEIEPPEDLFMRVKKDINEGRFEERARRGILQFKRGKMSGAMLTCCILLIISTAVIGSTIATIRKGYTNHRYDTFPKLEEIVKDLGFTPKYAEELPGGFKFSKGSSGKSQLSDEIGNLITKTRDLNLIYRREVEESSLSLNISQIEEEFIVNDSNGLVDNYNGINMYYYEKDYKFVPADYQLSQEDKMAYEAGKIEIFYGSSQVSYESVQALSWYEEGLHYTIMGSDYNFTIEQMLEMSKVIIDS